MNGDLAPVLNQSHPTFAAWSGKVSLLLIFKLTKPEPSLTE